MTIWYQSKSWFERLSCTSECHRFTMPAFCSHGRFIICLFGAQFWAIGECFFVPFHDAIVGNVLMFSLVSAFCSFFCVCFLQCLLSCHCRKMPLSPKNEFVRNAVIYCHSRSTAPIRYLYFLFTDSKQQYLNWNFIFLQKPNHYSNPPQPYPSKHKTLSLGNAVIYGFWFIIITN